MDAARRADRGGYGQPSRPSRQGQAVARAARGNQPPQRGRGERGQIRAEQHRARCRPGVERVNVEPAVEVADRHRAEDAVAVGQQAGPAQRERRGQARPDVGPGGERRLVELGLPPALVLGEHQRAGAHGEHDEQDRTALPHRRLATCQLASAAVSRLPWALSRSSSLAAAGSTRSGSSASPARARTGATASTGSMPSLPPDSRGTAEYLRSSQNATTPKASSAASSPALAAVAKAACLPRRSRAAPGVTGRSAGRTTTTMTSTAITAAGHHTPPARPRPSGPAAPPLARSGRPLADINSAER